MKYKLNETIATGKFKQVLAENYTKNFELLCQSIKLNKVQQKILDQFINHGTIKNQYVGRVAGVKKEKKFFAAKKQYKGSIENRNEALMKALKVNAHQQKILDSYLKTGKVIGKYAGSIAGSTKTTKSYSAFRGFKEHFESLPEPWEIKEGTWAVPDSKPKLDYLQKMFFKKPIKGTEKNARTLLVNMYNIFGDDSFYDDVSVFIDSPDPSKDLRNVIIYHLSDWGVGFKGYKISSAPVAWVDSDEGPTVGTQKKFEASIKRGKGNIKKPKGKTVVFEARSMSQKDIMRKYGNELKKALRGPSMDMSDKAEEALQQWVYDNYPEDIRTDDPDEWIEWLDRNLEDFVKGKLK